MTDVCSAGPDDRSLLAENVKTEALNVPIVACSWASEGLSCRLEVPTRLPKAFPATAEERNASRANGTLEQLGKCGRT